MISFEFVMSVMKLVMLIADSRRKERLAGRGGIGTVSVLREAKIGK